jgi:acetylornithine deacetylase/succinyl-diaminopimelate desuccinylase-like protein
MDTNKLISFVNNYWGEIIPALSQFIKIPCKSPLFDPEWKTNKYFEQADELFINWYKSQGIDGVKGEIINIEGKTPLLYIDVPGNSGKTILFYGHIDKMPEADGWDEGLGPWKPVVKNNKLYGRGGVDDGYAGFMPMALIKALRDQNLPQHRCVIIMEATEECGSPDFPPYLEILKERVNPDMVVIMDAGGDNYDQFWYISSLRGLINARLRIETMKMGVHSGVGSGIMPSTFRILRQLISRIEDENTGKILIPEFWTPIPEYRVEQAKHAAQIVGDELYKSLLPLPGAKPVSNDLTELLLNQTWRPYLEVISVDGFPPIKQAGNVLRPFTEAMLSIRIPPNVDAPKAAEVLKQTLEKDPPYNAKITFELMQCAPGWDAPKMEPWLESTLQKASQTYFGGPAVFKGEGGAIGVIYMMNKVFPNAQYVVSGLLGPNSNAHVANESLDIVAAKKLTCCVAEAMAAVR